MAVEELFTDEAMTAPFTGALYPQQGEAVDGDGTRYTSLFGMAVESGAPLTMHAFRVGLGPAG